MKRTNDWFELWMADKEGMIATMVRNMQADLDAGYNYFSNSIVKQRKEIDDYKKDFDNALDMIAMMDEKQAQRWCYIDLRRRGAIA